MTDDPTRSERLNLTSRVFHDFRQQADDTEPPAYEYLSDQDLMTALLGDLRHYADWQGIDFDRAIADGNAAYYQRRDEEEYPYVLGEEVEYSQRDSIQHYAGEDAPVAPRGIVASICPERNGTLTYHVRFLGEADTRPLHSEDLQPTPPFPRTATHQGPVGSLAEAERVLVETSARIRSCQLRHAPPADNDITDQGTISAALAGTCGLDAPDILRLLEPQIAAWTAETTRPWRPVPASHPAQVSALDFPQPAQPVTEPPGQTPDPGRGRHRRSGHTARNQGEATGQIPACQFSAHDQKAHQAHERTGCYPPRRPAPPVLAACRRRRTTVSRSIRKRPRQSCAQPHADPPDTTRPGTGCSWAPALAPGKFHSIPITTPAAQRRHGGQTCPGNRANHRGCAGPSTVAPSSTTAGSPAATDQPRPASPRRIHAVRHRTHRRLRANQKPRDNQNTRLASRG